MFSIQLNLNLFGKEEKRSFGVDSLKTWSIILKRPISHDLVSNPGSCRCRYVAAGHGSDEKEDDIKMVWRDDGEGDEGDKK